MSHPVNVLDLLVGQLESLADGRDRTVTHDRRVHTDGGVAYNPGQRSEAVGLDGLLGGEDDTASSVRDACAHPSSLSKAGSRLLSDSAIRRQTYRRHCRR